MTGNRRALPRRPSRIVALLLPLALALSAVAGCGGPAPTCAPTDGACLRILFIGNSYTYVNDLPGTFARLALSGGHSVDAESITKGGATLADHAADPAVPAKLDAAHWSYVVLQEQSEMPAVDSSRQHWTYPAARVLVDMVKQRNQTPVLFMTWAHRDGLPGSGLPGYENMQRAIDSGYLKLAEDVESAVAPVGYTWFIVRRQSPNIGLWQDDGSHPSTAGTYLAACVFYATVYRRSPEGLAFRSDLDAATAATLQKAAAAAVLDDPTQWGLP
jgi:hypothetical protein